MSTFKIEIVNNNFEVIKYMITAKNATFAKCSALIRYNTTYGDEPILVEVFPLQEKLQKTLDKIKKICYNIYIKTKEKLNLKK